MHPLSINLTPTRMQSWLKAAILFAYCWHVLPIDTAQHLINHFKLWSA